MKHRHKPVNQNLDSLTDVLCNVVGILIILLVVTQVCAGKVMDGELAKPASPGVTQEDLDRAEHNRSQLEDRLADIRAQWAEMEPQTTDIRAEIDRITGTLERAERELASLKSMPDETSGLNQAIEEGKRKKAELEAQLKKARQELERLAALHGQLSKKKRENTATASLPDPRPAPEGAKPVHFMCRYGQIVHLDVDSVLEPMYGVIRETLGNKTSFWLSDLFKVKKHFDSHDIGNALFRWRMLVYKQSSSVFGLQSELMWRSQDVGESLAQIRHAGSDFQRRLGSLEKNNQYLNFFVWSDSFDTYLEARRIAEELGLAAGWTAYDTDEEFRYDLASGSGGGGARKAVD